MKKLTLLLFSLVMFSGFAQTITVTPENFSENDEITITVTNFDPVTEWQTVDIYLWAWYFDLNDTFKGNSPTNGEFSNSNEIQKFTNDNGSYTYTLTPSQFYNDPDIGRIGFLIKSKDGTSQSADNLYEVGTFQVIRTAPEEESVIVDLNESLTISATSQTNSNFELKANGVVVNTAENEVSYTYNYTVTGDTTFELEVTEVSTNKSLVKTFSAVVAKDPDKLPVPAGLKDGFNLDPNDPTKAILVLFAPEKRFVYAKGNFSSPEWEIQDQYLMNLDEETDRFWITLENLPTEGDLLYQYEIDSKIIVGDPYSTLILSPYDEAGIDDSVFPNRPDYPQGQTMEAITWVRLGETPYDWKITDFERPKVTDLVIYELLIRDFDALHTFDAVKNRLDYLVDLGINAIELLPVSEFDGNESWGYNPSFHMALDKYYGTPTAFKEFVDECHARGIAVILDVVYNHGTGQNVQYRMWNECNGCYDGKPLETNPFYNVSSPNTSFSFFNDMDHESEATQQYIDRLNKFWLEEYNIDGYRFDFTKGFTNFMGNGEAFDQSRINILTRMNDFIKTVDPNAYVILEHLAGNDEETELIEEGMLVWSNLNFNYNQATMGYNNSNFDYASYLNRDWEIPANIPYMESHDEERLMFKNIQFGNQSQTSDYNVKDLATGLDRLELGAAFYFTIPGPKMIWQFGELGYDFSINYCIDSETNDESCRTGNKPIRWDYFDIPERRDVYNLYAKLIKLKKQEKIFKTSNFTLDVADDFKKRIFLTDEEATGDEIKHLTIIGNFNVNPIDINPGFQETGTWYDLLSSTEESIEVTDVNANLTLAPGEFKVYANQPSTVLSTETFSSTTDFIIYPNPSKSSFALNKTVQNIAIYNLSGALIREFTGNNQINQSFSVEGITSGMYLLQINTNNSNETLKLHVK